VSRQDARVWAERQVAAAAAIHAKRMELRTLVAVNTSVHVRPAETDPARIHWHVNGWRCRVALTLYGLTRRIGRLADRIDRP
jgi:hypothetical protein